MGFVKNLIKEVEINNNDKIQSYNINLMKKNRNFRHKN